MHPGSAPGAREPARFCKAPQATFPGGRPPLPRPGTRRPPGGTVIPPELPASWEEPESRGTGLPRRPPAPATSPPSPARRPPALTDGDGGHDEGVPEEERGGLGGEVAAEILKEQVLLGLLLGGAAFGSHGGAGAGSEEAQTRARPSRGPLAPPPRPPNPLTTRQPCARGGACAARPSELGHDWPSWSRCPGVIGRVG